MLAQRGDRAAMARIRMQRQSRQRPQGHSQSSQTKLQSMSFVSFHPPLNKRAKRLERMGAHLEAPARRGGLGGKIALGILYLILGPLLAVVGVLMLFLIAVMIGLNLLCLALWLAAIHWIFAQDWERNIRAFVGFVQEVAAAFSRSR
jgi:Zn-dependent protease with chaperone function